MDVTHNIHGVNQGRSTQFEQVVAWSGYEKWWTLCQVTTSAGPAALALRAQYLHAARRAAIARAGLRWDPTQAHTRAQGGAGATTRARAARGRARDLRFAQRAVAI